MKRWRYLCAAALIAGSMAAGTGAVIDTEHCFNTVAAAVAGRYFRRQRPIPHSSVCARAGKNLYKISADSLYGIADLKNGK